jgi:aminoglycoside phosphotransferase family enzyme/predicted kinase
MTGGARVRPADPVAEQRLLVERLRERARREHPGDAELIETHISHVLLAGAFAYKFKKPLNLGFLDFTALEARRRFCAEEVRLNRRLAPAFYLDVVAVTEEGGEPRFGGPGGAVEYAVRMRRFRQEGLLDRLAPGGALDARIEALAQQVAAFHAAAPAAGSGTLHGEPFEVVAPAAENFAQLLVLCTDPARHARLERLRDWTEAEAGRLNAAFRRRKREGRVRECHGDLHLGNMVLVDGEVVIFDCIEFEPGLRWIDVMSEVAFLAMDLYRRGLPGLARRFLNAYLEETGDYAGVAVLRFYLVYRAMVRAKVAAIRAGQAAAGDGAAAAMERECEEHLRLAERFVAAEAPMLLVMCGVSASGKSRFSRRLLPLADAIRVRSDVERKRMHGLKALEKSGSALDRGLYTQDATAAVYDRVAELCRAILDAGWVAIADATFLKRWQRERLRREAREAGVPCAVVEFAAAEAVLRGRVERRLKKADNASEADLEVLARQLAAREPLAGDEADVVLRIDTGVTSDPDPMEILARARGA